jgi:urease accessory protein
VTQPVPVCVRPQLDLSFLRQPGGPTYLDRRRFRWPYTISRGFHLDLIPAGMLTLIVQTVSGAIQGDDRLLQRLHVGPGAAAHVTTQGATAVYRASPNLSATDDVELSVGDDALLEYLPEPRILFPESSLSQQATLRVAASGVAILSDGFVLHDPAGAGRSFRHFASQTVIERPDGGVLAADRLELDGMPRRSGRRARYAAYGTMIVVACDRGDSFAGLCEAISVRVALVPHVYAGMSCLPHGSGVSLRVAATDGRHLRAGLEAGWHAARRHLFGTDPAPRRKEARY